jgi:tRNA-dihydrouridine synthase B
MKLALSPMATLTHEALRILIHRYGDPDEYYSEMIHAPSYLAGGSFEKYYVRSAPCPEKMVWQLTGAVADPMVKVAGILKSLGGIGVDLNMGCSAPDIARFGAGIAWMTKPQAETMDLVRRVRSALDGCGGPNPSFRLSVKLRLGIDENYPRLLEFCRALAGEGVELITLHPRIKSDKYGRPARRAFVSRLAGDLSVPVYGNGDVDSAENALGYMTGYPCSGLMIGRSAVQKPWIFRDIRAAESGRAEDGGAEDAAAVDHLEVARFFLETLKTSQPPEFQISRARRFFFYYCDNFSFAHHIKMRIQNAKAPDEIGGLLEEYFAEVPGDRMLR